MLSTGQWLAYFFVSLSITAAYLIVPRKLKGLLKSHAYVHTADAAEARAWNIHVISLFIVWCGVHHLVMVPLMFALMVYGYQEAFWALISIDSVVAIVSLRAALWLRVKGV